MNYSISGFKNESIICFNIILYQEAILSLSHYSISYTWVCHKNFSYVRLRYWQLHMCLDKLSFVFILFLKFLVCSRCPGFRRSRSIRFLVRLILNQPWFQLPERIDASAWDTGKNYHAKQLSYLTLQKVIVMNVTLN